MPASDGRSRSCPRCGALNSAGFDRCVRCSAPLQPLAAAADVLKRSVDPSALLGTKVLFGLTLLVFLAQLAANLQTLQGGRILAVLLGGLRGMERFGALPESWEVVRAEPLRLLSAVFVHFNALHVAMNMMVFTSLGRVAEPGVGTARFVVAYLVTGVVGFVASVAWHQLLGVPGFTAGASGAVFGMMGLILGWLFQTRDRRPGIRDRRWLRYAVSTAASAALVNLFPVNVNNAAHLGGLFCGVAFGFYYAARPRPRSLWLPNLGAIAGLLLVVASLVLAQRAD